MKSNFMYMLAGIAIGVFVYTVVGQVGGEVSLEQSSHSLNDSEDMEQLKRQLEMSQKRVSRVESMLAAATVADNQISKLRGENQDEGAVKTFANLIDKSKPVLRELMLPELEKNMASGNWREFRKLDKWSKELDFSEKQKRKIRKKLDHLARERADHFIEALKDDQTSMFSMFEEMSQFEKKGDVEIDKIFKEEVDEEQYGLYEEQRFNESIQHVQDEADSRLDMLNRQVPNLTVQQQDEIYTILARNSTRYSSDMQIAVGEDISDVVNNPILTSEERNSAIDEVIQPHQRQEWEVYKKRESLLSGLNFW